MGWGKQQQQRQDNGQKLYFLLFASPKLGNKKNNFWPAKRDWTAAGFGGWEGGGKGSTRARAFAAASLIWHKTHLVEGRRPRIYKSSPVKNNTCAKQNKQATRPKSEGVLRLPHLCQDLDHLFQGHGARQRRERQQLVGGDGRPVVLFVFCCVLLCEGATRFR
jgi:hypothetical protein